MKPKKVPRPRAKRPKKAPTVEPAKNKVYPRSLGLSKPRTFGYRNPYND